MIRCLDCNSTLTKEETACFTCGATVKLVSAQMVFGERFASFLKFAFLGSGVLTIASLFFDATPSFAKCLTTTVVLLFVRSSAEQMLERKKG